MRRPVPLYVPPAALLLLLTAAAPDRLALSSPLDSFGAFETVGSDRALRLKVAIDREAFSKPVGKPSSKVQVPHPASRLEEGAIAAGESPWKLALGGRRRMTPLTAENPYQINGFRFKGSEMARTISDSGGVLQLLLLLLLCIAVFCCASMSLSHSTWCKFESPAVRKVLQLLCAAATFFSELSSRGAGQGGSEGKHSRTSKPASDRSTKGQTVQAERVSSKKARTKRRKAGSAASDAIPGSAMSNPPARPLEKTASSGNSSLYEVSSVHSGDIEPEPLWKEESPQLRAATPADLQIARLEVEATRQNSQRAAKVKRPSKKSDVQDEGLVIDTAIATSVVDTQTPSEMSSSLQSAGEGRAKAPARRGNGPKDPKDPTTTKLAKAPKAVDPDSRDRLGRKTPAAEKAGTRLSQVLVVPRRQAGRNRERQRQRHSGSDEERDTSLAPRTPERTAPAEAAFSSPQSSVYSPSLPSRPYAQVAKESGLIKDRASPPPPPPPPPQPRVGALPHTAVYAREFRPKSQSPTSGLNASAPAFSPGQRTQPAQSAPPHAGFLQAQLPEPPSATSSPLPSPFPGMSLHRRLVSPSPAPPSSPGELAGGSSGTAFKGLGFPGVFSTIWSTSAVGSESSWLPTGSAHTSLDGCWAAKASAEPFEDDLVVLGRQGSW